MAIDLGALGVFVKVAELASFTRAADHLGMPKARASAQVARLEAELGVSLLQRTTRTVRLTPDGEQLLGRAKPLLAEADDVGAMFQGGPALRGVVRVDLPMVTARDFVLPRVPELTAAHPQLELQISTTDRRVDVVREGFDVVLRIGNLAASELMVQRLGQFTIINCASPGYVHRHGMPTSLEELDRHVLVHYAQTFGRGEPELEYWDGARYATVRMRAPVTVNSADSYRVAAIAGLGIIQVPRIGVRADLEAGRLVEVLPALRAEPMPASLLHPYGRSVPRRVRVVMKWLAEVVAPRLD